MFNIRLYNPARASDNNSDLEALYHICLLTADNGGDASHIYSHPEMIGDFFAAPYAVLEPTLAFLLEDSQGICGYIVGALDTDSFNTKMNTQWLPTIRQKYPKETLKPEEQWLSDNIHTDVSSDEALAAYPSHLHIDLLPRAQKQGQGKALMHTLWQALKAAGSTGVHLGVSTKNPNAIGFYEKIGFERELSYDTAIVMCKKL